MGVKVRSSECKGKRNFRYVSQFTKSTTFIDIPVIARILGRTIT